jgi:hypothetical protein
VRRVPGQFRTGATAAGLIVAAFFICAGPAGAVTPTQIVSVINAERHLNGLPSVRQDPSLSAGCAAYDHYRYLNGSVQDGFTPGPEQAGKPGYTKAGARAGQDSLLNAGDRPADSWANGDVFDDAPGHLYQLMSPDIAAIGADQLDVDLGSFFGTASISCIDTRSAPVRSWRRLTRLFHYLGPTGKLPNPPLSYREGPFGVGPVVFLYFMVPHGATVTLRSLRLQARGGARSNPAYVRLTGGVRDGRKNPSARVSKATGNGAPVDPAVELGLGPSYLDYLKAIVLYAIVKGLSHVSVSTSQALAGHG